jgi:arylformamidase
MNITDISPELTASSPVWPGDTALQQEPHFTIGPELAVNVDALKLTAHIGSHIDAPRHVIPDGADVSSTPLESCVGPATVLDVSEQPSDEPISLAQVRTRLAELGIKRPAARLILKRYEQPLTSWDDTIAGVCAEVVHWAAEHGVCLIGLDLMSFDAHNSKDLPAHRAAIANGIVMLEGLQLQHASEGNTTLIALPLRLRGGDASPVRAVLIEDSQFPGR